MEDGTAGELSSLHRPKSLLQASPQPEDLEWEMLVGRPLDEVQLSRDHGETVRATRIRIRLHFYQHYRRPRRRRRGGGGGGRLHASEVKDQDVEALVERVELPIVGQDIVKVAFRAIRGRSFCEIRLDIVACGGEGQL